LKNVKNILGNNTIFNYLYQTNTMKEILEITFKRMTITDKVISSTILIAIVAAFIFKFSICMKVIGALIGMYYLFFVSAHLALGLPLGIVIIITTDFIKKNNFYKTVRKMSYFIFLLVYLSTHLLSIFVAYVVVPYIGAMFWNVSFSMIEATQLLQQIF